MLNRGKGRALTNAPSDTVLYIPSTDGRQAGLPALPLFVMPTLPGRPPNHLFCDTCPHQEATVIPSVIC
jgi:hypothetical protein